MGNKLDTLIFRPPFPSYSINDPHLHMIPTPTGNSIAAYYIKHRNARFTIIFSHGNAEDIGHVFTNLVNRLTNWNCNIFIYDYPGYGLSDGITSEENLYYTTDIAYKYLVDELNVNKSTIVAYGRSLGCSCAIYLGVKYKLLGVVLQSPFLSIHRVKLSISLPFDKFNNLDKVKRLKCPALVLHGDDDEVISIDHSKELIKSIPDVYYYFIKNGRHNNLDYDFPKIMDSCLLEYFDILLLKYSGDTNSDYYSDQMINQVQLNHHHSKLSHVLNAHKDSFKNYKSADEGTTIYLDADNETMANSDFEQDNGKKAPNKCYFCLIF